MERFIVTIEGPNWTDSDELELLGLPAEGEPIETKFGLCTVTHAELSSGVRHVRGQDRLQVSLGRPVPAFIR